jgi:nicotinate-nucleotide--dimethylbenzimidazole phosphoribosyltransferase
MAQKKVALKTKPLGALGRIEELAVQLSAIQRSLNPTIDCRRMFVFAGDHGVVEEGVSAFPAKVTVQMGIGNTSSASAIICAVTGLTPEQAVGRGTGVDDRGLERKREAIEKALALHDLSGSDGLALLRTIGGYELGGICGAVIAAASEGCCVVLDGLISTAAGLLAYLICPDIKEYLIAGHKSVEIGQQAALHKMGLEPVLDLGLRLGEGTGAAITMNLVELSCKMMRDMASFEKAGVDSGSP